MAETSFKIIPASYFCPERARQEWDAIWTKLWHLGPREEELPEPGDVFVHSLGHESLIFVRGMDSMVRGFFNVCRHRGSRILLNDDGPCHVKQFSCPFHGWCYGLDGQLGNVPHSDRFDFDDVESETRPALQTFRVASFSGWLWFTLNEEAPDLLTYLGPVGPMLTSYRMNEARIYDYKTFEFKANWKVTLDAFNESYHFQALHRELLSWGNETAPIELFGIHSMMINEYGSPSSLYLNQTEINPALKAMLQEYDIDPETFSGAPSDVRLAIQREKRKLESDVIYPYSNLSDGQLTDAYHFLIFPSVHFNLFPEFYVAMRYRPHPSGDPERMHFDFIMCAPPEVDEVVQPYTHRIVEAGAEPVESVIDWGEHAHPIVNMVLEQDISLIEHVHMGQKSQSFLYPIIGKDEIRIEHFHRNLDDLITQRRPLSSMLELHRKGKTKT